MHKIYDFTIFEKIKTRIFWKQNEIIRLRQEIEKQKAQLQLLQEELKKQEQQTKQIISARIAEETNNLLYNRTWIKELNRTASGIPTVWGREERLHISPLAAVYSCLFNTNSGEITVGDYTFAGSNVSFLAGSHDMNLKGVLRRDTEFCSGYDIIIGSGVWLGSNCTILGPCRIGDNAVVAAGAIVAPGTDIETNSVYAGTPARKIKNILPETDIGGLHMQNALIREQGILYTDGFSEKRFFKIGKQEFCGHWIVANKAHIYTNREKVELVLHKEIEEKAEVLVICDDGSQKCIFADRDEDVSFVLKKGKDTSIELCSDVWGIGTVFVTSHL